MARWLRRIHSIETGIEESLRIGQGSALGKGQLDRILISLSGAYDPCMGPYGYPERIAGFDPFALFHDIRIGLMDEAANFHQYLGAPVTKSTDSLGDKIGG